MSTEIESCSKQSDSLTGDPHLDINILLYLSDIDLQSVSKTNKYFQELCLRDELWSKKLIHTFGHEILNHKDTDLKSCYFRLINIPFESDKLCYLAEQGNLPMIKYLYQNGVKLNGDILHVAICDGMIDIADWLHQKGIKLNVSDSCGHAAKNGHLKSLEWLVSHSYPIYNIAVNQAARHGRIDILNWLGDRQIFPSDKDLSRAVKEEQFETIKWGVDRGLFPDQTGLDRAAGTNDWDIINLLAEYGKLPGPAGLTWAATNGHIDMVQWLIDNNVIPYQYVANYPATTGKINSLELLEKYGYLPNDDGFQGAVETQQLEVVKWMESRGLISKKTKNIGRRIYQSITFGNLDMLKILSQYHPVFTEIADLAVELGYLHILEWLINHEIYPSIRRILKSRPGYGGESFTDEYVIKILKLFIDKDGELSKKVINEVRKSKREAVISWLESNTGSG